MRTPQTMCPLVANAKRPRNRFGGLELGRLANCLPQRLLVDLLTAGRRYGTRGSRTGKLFHGDGLDQLDGDVVLSPASPSPPSGGSRRRHRPSYGSELRADLLKNGVCLPPRLDRM